LTSSLDCSFRLWHIEGENSTRGVCLKEFYLYNKVEYFDILGTSFLFGLGMLTFSFSFTAIFINQNSISFEIISKEAGKVQLWDCLGKVREEKLFQDDDNVNCVKFLGSDKFYALTQTGKLKKLAINGKENTFDLIKEAYVPTNCNFKIICVYKLRHTIDNCTIDFIATNSSKKTVDWSRRNFKMFEIVDADKLLLVNDNQAFVILYDLAKSNI
jgi:hypothetical protein